MNKLFAFFISMFFCLTVQATTCTSVSSGNANATGTWSCGRVPQDNDTIVIAALHTVTLTAHASLDNVYIKVYGTLHVNNGKKLDIDENSRIQIYSGGTMSGANGGSQLRIDGTTVWSGGAGADAEGPLYAEDGMASMASGVLPIKLMSFTASLKDKTKVELSWITAAELNNDFFTVERSINGLNFTAIATVKGAGNSSVRRSYSATDSHPPQGAGYYRLRQTDFNGEYTFSQIVAINYENDQNGGCVLKVYPNPCPGRCNVDLSGCDMQEAPEIKVEMMDAAGNKVYSTVPYRDDKGGFSLSLDTENNLKPGVYIVTGLSKNEKYSNKLLVK